MYYQLLIQLTDQQKDGPTERVTDGPMNSQPFHEILGVPKKYKFVKMVLPTCKIRVIFMSIFMVF